MIKNMPKTATKYYSFVDVVIDIFYSIILYNAFIAFPGFRIESFLMLFAIFVMLNYWWAVRSYNEMPKHYLVDFYCITIVMFLFSQWPNYFLSYSHFALATAVFFCFDAVYALIDIFAHGERQDERSLWFYCASELALAAIYFGLSRLFDSVSAVSIVLIFVPYAIWYLMLFKLKFIKTRFIDAGNQPY